MPRRKLCRNLQGPPCCGSFKPKGIPSRFLKVVTITLDEYESIRLADYENLEHEEASLKLGVSRSVFTRLVDAARKKVAIAIVEGCELTIDGGEYHFENKHFRCLGCYHLFDLPLNSDDPTECPKCKSINLENLNTSYGIAGKCKRHAHGTDI